MIGLCQDSWTHAHSLSRIKPQDRSLLSARPNATPVNPLRGLCRIQYLPSEYSLTLLPAFLRLGS
jgi:hypothetical protein